ALLRQTAEGALASFLPGGLVRAASAAVLAVSLIFVFGANAAFERGLQLTAGKPADILLGKMRWTWPQAREMTEPWLADGAVIVTSEEMLAAEWIGDFDIGYNRPRFSELLFLYGPETPPFTPDWRSGRPMIGLFDDLARIIACEPVGIFVSNATWLNRSGLPLRMTRVAQATGATVTTERGAGVALLGWRREPSAPAPELALSCAALPTVKGSRAADRLRRE
ncbi:MAG: hypothetical protein AAF492_16170, partial [Verrucomicrobiota bacterium]